MDLPFQPPTVKWLDSLSDGEKISIKQNIFNSLSLCVLPGLAEANVLHRDLKTDNLLYLPNSGTVVACDFGVGFIENYEMKPGPRGALKYYPVQAIDDSNFYQPWCDEYFASLSFLEILTESRIFPDLDVSEIIGLRKTGIEPEIPKDIMEKFPEASAWIVQIGKKMDTN